MIFYATRHGQTEWNVLDKICGRSDIELTEKGIEQAKALANRMKEEGIRPDVIIASPLKRALNTAEIIKEAVNGPEIIIDDRLIEQKYGYFEGRPRLAGKYLENKKNFAYRYPGGESMMMMAQRVYNLIDELREKYEGKTVHLVCHGGVCRVINTYFNDIKNEDYFLWEAENCCLLKYDTEKISGHSEFVGDDYNE